MRPVDTAQHAEVFARCCESFERHSHAGHADDGVENGDFDLPTGFLDGLDDALEFRD
jgi:hypothetical protein